MITQAALEAAKLYKQASDLIDKAEAILMAEGITVCGVLKSEYKDKLEPQIQIHTGILKLTTNPNEIKPKPPMFTGLGLSADEKTGWIKINGINFFQCKTASADKMTLR